MTSASIHHRLWHVVRIIENEVIIPWPEIFLRSIVAVNAVVTPVTFPCRCPDYLCCLSVCIATCASCYVHTLSKLPTIKTCTFQDNIYASTDRYHRNCTLQRDNTWTMRDGRSMSSHRTELRDLFSFLHAIPIADHVVLLCLTSSSDNSSSEFLFVQKLLMFSIC